MNYEQAEKAMPSASRTVEVLERLEVECPRCKGQKEIGVSSDGCPIYCHICRHKGKVKWKWEPKSDDYFVTDEGTIIRIPRHFTLNRNALAITDPDSPTTFPMIYLMEDITFISHWEDDIEPALEKAGYMLSFETHYKGEPPKTLVLHKVSILKPAVVKGKWGDETIVNSWEGQAKSRQEAMTMAMDTLGKELECGVKCQ